MSTSEPNPPGPTAIIATEPMPLPGADPNPNPASNPADIPAPAASIPAAESIATVPPSTTAPLPTEEPEKLTHTTPCLPQVHPEEISTGKKLTPFASPLPHCVPPRPAPLTPDQQKKYALLLTQVSAPQIKGLPTPLNDLEKMFLTRDCLLRYLRASKWDTVVALTRVVSTLLWRREYAPHAISPEHVSPENETGKQWLLGYDKQGRPCLALNPARQNTDPSDRQIQHLVFMLERAIDLMPPGQGTLALKIDFAGISSGKTPSLSTAKQVLNILQNHYPERLGRAISLSLPWFVSTFYKLITPFVDPLTREKLVFPSAKEKKGGENGEAEITNYVPKEQLEKEVGGACDFEYRHAVYWPALVELCKCKREDYEARWRERGARIGDGEVFLRGGSEQVDSD